MTNLTLAEQLATSNASQYNGNRYDQTSNAYGYSGTGYLTNFPQSMNDAATIMNAMDRLLTQSDENVTAQAAIVASRPKATSLTLAGIVSTGDLTFTTVENLLTGQPFFVGDFVKIFSTGSSSNYVYGSVFSISANAISIHVSASGGAGNFSSWTIIGSGAQGAATGISSVQADTAPRQGGDLHTNGHAIRVDGSSADQIVFASGSTGIEMNGGIIDQPRLQAYGEPFDALGNVMNTVAITRTAGNHNTCTLAGNTSFTLPSGLPTTDKIGLSLRIAQPAGQAYTIAWPSNITWVGTAPAAPVAGKRLEVLFDTMDGGATYIGFTRFVNV